MRIGIVTTSYPRFADDPAGTFVAGHARWLRAAGHTVEVIAARDRTAMDAGSEFGIPIHGVPAPAGLFYRGGAPDALERTPLLLAGAARFAAAQAVAVRRHAARFDAIVAHWLAPSALAAVPTRLPLLAIAHSGDVHLLARLGLTRLAALGLQRARLVFVSRALRDGFCGALPAALAASTARRALVQPMAIDVARLAAARRPGGGHGVLFLGRLVPIKGLAVLARAAPMIAAPITIAGAGPGAPRELHCVGEVRGAARDQLLAAARVLVVPSLPTPTGRTEGLPTVILEAMAAGVPVVASDTGGISELPSEVVTRVPSGDPRSLAQAINALLSDDFRWQRQRNRALRYAQRCSWEVVGPRLLRHLGIPTRD